MYIIQLQINYRSVCGIILCFGQGCSRPNYVKETKLIKYNERSVISYSYGSHWEWSLNVNMLKIG